MPERFQDAGSCTRAELRAIEKYGSARRVLKAAAETHSIEGQELTVTARIGESVHAALRRSMRQQSPRWSARGPCEERCVR